MPNRMRGEVKNQTTEAPQMICRARPGAADARPKG